MTLLYVLTHSITHEYSDRYRGTFTSVAYAQEAANMLRHHWARHNKPLSWVEHPDGYEAEDEGNDETFYVTPLRPNVLMSLFPSQPHPDQPFGWRKEIE